MQHTATRVLAKVAPYVTNVSRNTTDSVVAIPDDKWSTFCADVSEQSWPALARHLPDMILRPRTDGGTGTRVSFAVQRGIREAEALLAEQCRHGQPRVRVVHVPVEDMVRHVSSGVRSDPVTSATVRQVIYRSPLATTVVTRTASRQTMVRDALLAAGVARNHVAVTTLAEVAAAGTRTPSTTLYVVVDAAHEMGSIEHAIWLRWSLTRSGAVPAVDLVGSRHVPSTLCGWSLAFQFRDDYVPTAAITDAIAGDDLVGRLAGLCSSRAVIVRSAKARTLLTKRMRVVHWLQVSQLARHRFLIPGDAVSVVRVNDLPAVTESRRVAPCGGREAIIVTDAIAEALSPLQWILLFSYTQSYVLCIETPCDSNVAPTFADVVSDAMRRGRAMERLYRPRLTAEW